jgi:hypothetical protein
MFQVELMMQQPELLAFLLILQQDKHKLSLLLFQQMPAVILHLKIY